MILFNVLLTHHKYTYDAAGHLVSDRRYNNANVFTGTWYYVYEGNDLKTFYNVAAGNSFQQEFTYSYDGALANTIASKNYGKYYLGEESEHAYTRVVEVSPPSYINITDRTFTYDASGRIVSSGWVSSAGAPGTAAYTYY